MNKLFITIHTLLLLLIPVTASTDQNQPGSDRTPQLFATSDQCMACHNGLTTPSGEDVSIGFQWRSSMMANSSRDPYWQAGVRREIMDHPESRGAIENECAACHMSMSRFQSKVNGKLEGVFVHLPQLQNGNESDQLAADGASCTMCHQIQSDGFGTRESFVAGFKVDTGREFGERQIYGPFSVDQGRRRIMQSSSLFQPEEGLHVQQSELCATCHTLITHSLDSNGNVIAEFPEQVPYLEWQHSEYSDTKSCQDCHMKAVEGKIAVSSVLGDLREDFSQHSFRGGNFFLPRVLNRYRQELGVEALSSELDSTSRSTLDHLMSDAASIEITEVTQTTSHLKVVVQISSKTGHKLPTAYPSRRVWIRFTVKDHQNQMIFESGAFEKTGAIQGNDNDSDPARFEPHYEVISNSDQVQIYEPILAGPDGSVTTGLLEATQYLKDNRLLPIGFDKNDAEPEIAVHGRASQDSTFAAGGDQVEYQVSLKQNQSPLLISVELWYQPIGFRWAQNLKEYDAFEPKRFVGYYESMAEESATVLATASRKIQH